MHELLRQPLIATSKKELRNVVWKNKQKVITDSGGLQKEAYFAKIPALVMMPDTSWIELIEAGWNVLVDADAQKIVVSLSCMDRVMLGRRLWRSFPANYFDRVCEQETTVWLNERVEPASSRL